MSSTSSERLVEELARDLEPVRRVPPLRRTTAIVLGVGAVAGVVGLAVTGANAELGEAVRRYPSLLAITAGLLLVAVGGTVAALAGAVPGRESEARAAFWVTVVGAAVALGVGGLLAFTGPEASIGAAPIGAAGMCASIATMIALPAAAIGLGFVLRGAPGRPLSCLAAAAAGSVALGSIANHMHCAQFDAAHLVLGHALAPVLGILLLALPGWLLWRRIASRSVHA